MLDPAAKLSTSPYERAQRLESSCWLPSKFSFQQIQRVAAYFEFYRFTGEHILIAESKPCEFMGIITAGKAYVLKKSVQGKQQAIAEIGVNHSFGEMAIMDGGSASATVRTSGAQPFDVLVITKKWFETLIEEEPRLAATILQNLAKEISLKLRRTTGLLIDHL